MEMIRVLTRHRNILRKLLITQIRTSSNVTMTLGKKLKKLEKAEKPVETPVETDPNVLATYVCGTNLYAENGENVKIKPDSEYPDWLWTLPTEPIPISKLDPNTLEYWEAVRKQAIDERKRLNKLYSQYRDYK